LSSFAVPEAASRPRLALLHTAIPVLAGKDLAVKLLLVPVTFDIPEDILSVLGGK